MTAGFVSRGGSRLALRRGLAPEGLLTLALGTALLVGMIFRFTVGWDRQFWSDEVWTGFFAANRLIGDLMRDISSELGGPTYYIFTWAWAKLFGLGDTALRIPSFLFSVAAPLLILWKGPGDRIVRYVWAATAALFMPLLLHAAEARSYPLLFLFGVVQAIALGRLLRAPSMGKAFAWTTASALVFATHYLSLPLIGLQGLLVLAMLRGRAFRYWPALIVFAPALICLGLQIRFLLSFGQGGAWQPLLQFDRATMFQVSNDILGLGRASLVMLVLIAATGVWDLYARIRFGRPAPYDRVDLAISAASAGAVLFAIILGFMKPTYVDRYLLGALPGVLLGVAIWARRLGSAWHHAPILVAVAFIGATGLYWVRTVTKPVVDLPSWEAASGFLREQKVRKIYPYWHYGRAASGPLGLERFSGRAGGFFFSREGVPVEVDFFQLPLMPPGDASDMIRLKALGDAAKPGEGFFWVYITGDHTGPMVGRDPAGFAARATGMNCRLFGTLPHAPSVTLACARPARDNGPTG